MRGKKEVLNEADKIYDVKEVTLNLPCFRVE